MSIPSFLRQLQETGRVRVAQPGAEITAQPSEVTAVIEELDLAARLSFPGEAPPLSLEWAGRGAAVLYRACQAFAFRDVSAEAVEQGVALPRPADATAATHYSVDLALRYLPDLFQLARGLSPSDPLVTAIVRLGRDWPVSSVGIPGLEGVQLGEIQEHAGLLRLYVDRILEREDTSRLDNERVREAVKEALGAHISLCPEVGAAIPQENPS